MRHTLLSTDDMSIAKGFYLLPCHFQIMSTLIYLQVTVNNSHCFIITELCTKTLLHLISISGKCRECSIYVAKNIAADHLTAQLLRSCSELLRHMQSRFPHDVAQMHNVQIRD